MGIVCVSLTLCDPVDCRPPGSCPWNSPDKNTVVGSHSLLQGIFLNPGLQHCRQILYSLSHQLRQFRSQQYPKKDGTVSSCAIVGWPNIFLKHPPPHPRTNFPSMLYWLKICHKWVHKSNLWSQIHLWSGERECHDCLRSI